MSHLSDEGEGRSGGASGGTGSGVGGAGSSGVSGNGGSGGAGEGGAPDECEESATVARRIVKLTTSQLVSSVSALLGDDIAREATTDRGLPPLEQRWFPMLATTGTIIGDLDVAIIDALAGFRPRSSFRVRPRWRA